MLRVKISLLFNLPAGSYDFLLNGKLIAILQGTVKITRLGEQPAMMAS
jgi:hypothetical protein